MPPVVHPFPVMRPGFIQSAEWIGGPEDMTLEVAYQNLAGGLEVVSFQTKGENPGEICVPSSNDLANLGPRGRDILVAHLRMACMVHGSAVPGSREFEDIWVNQSGSNYFQTALGTTKITAVTAVSDAECDITWRVGTGPLFVTRVGHGEINAYAYAPSTQLYVVPGSVKKQFANYVHDWPGTVLTQAQKDAIVDYVVALKPWI